MQEHDKERFEPTLQELYGKIKSGVDFRDKEDLYRELGDEYNTLGNKERADYFYGLENEERSKRSLYGVSKPKPLEVK